MSAIDTLSTARRLTAEQNPAATAEGDGRRECSIHRIGSRHGLTPATQPILSVSPLAIPECEATVPHRLRGGHVVRNRVNDPCSPIHRQCGRGGPGGRHDHQASVGFRRPPEGEASRATATRCEGLADASVLSRVSLRPDARHAPCGRDSGARQCPRPRLRRRRRASSRWSNPVFRYRSRRRPAAQHSC